MKANQIKVLYISQWEEGNIESDAVLDLNTGMIVDISDGHDNNYDNHIKDVIQIGADRLGLLEADVDADANNDYRIPDSRQLETFRVAARFEVLTQELGGFVSASTQDGAPTYFQTLEAARLDLEDHLLDVQKAVFDGDMTDEYDPSEFRIRGIATGELLDTEWDQTEISKLVFVRSDIVYGLDIDQPTVCPQCGSRTDFDELPSGLQRHQCINQRCNRLFFAASDGDTTDEACENSADIDGIARVISQKLDDLGFRNKGKKIKYTQVLEVAAAVEGFRNRHVAKAGKKIATNAEMPPNRARLIIEVDYDLNDESIEDMAANLRGMADYAIQNGMLTGATTAEVDDYKVDVITSCSAAPSPDQDKMKYAVIGYYDDNGQIFCHHVEARDAFNAFAIVAAKADEDGMLPQFIAALPVSDTSRLEYPGEGVVSFETVLKQNDVFPL